jgi:predicted nuclease of predicted toxin-antitoxin system
MNLSPEWVGLLSARGWDACHWSQVGAPNALDSELLAFARKNSYVIITQDLDFSQLLFATQAAGPSVVLLRVDNEFDPELQAHVCDAIASVVEALENGGLLTISPKRVRLRHLPIAP